MLFDYLPKAQEGGRASEGDLQLGCLRRALDSEVFQETEHQAQAQPEKAGDPVVLGSRVRATSSEKQEVQRPSAQVVEVASQPVWGAYFYMCFMVFLASFEAANALGRAQRKCQKPLAWWIASIPRPPLQSWHHVPRGSTRNPGATGRPRARRRPGLGGLKRTSSPTARGLMSSSGSWHGALRC